MSELEAIVRACPPSIAGGLQATRKLTGRLSNFEVADYSEMDRFLLQFSVQAGVIHLLTT